MLRMKMMAMVAAATAALGCSGAAEPQTKQESLLLSPADAGTAGTDAWYEWYDGNVGFGCHEPTFVSGAATCATGELVVDQYNAQACCPPGSGCETGYSLERSAWGWLQCIAQ